MLEPHQKLPEKRGWLTLSCNLKTVKDTYLMPGQVSSLIDNL